MSPEAFCTYACGFSLIVSIAGPVILAWADMFLDRIRGKPGS